MEPIVPGQGLLILTMTNDIHQLPALRAAVEDFAHQAGFAATRGLDLQLVIEEAVANVIRHAWDDGQHTITVRLAQLGEDIMVEVEDDGRPFDPLSHAPFDSDMPLELRRCGGLGLHLIRQLSDTLTYTRLDDRNRLRMTLSARSPENLNAS